MDQYYYAKFYLIYLPILLQDVAVKVLADQDFHNDQLKEFLREVSKLCVLDYKLYCVVVR